MIFLKMIELKRTVRREKISKNILLILSEKKLTFNRKYYTFISDGGGLCII